LACAVPIYNPPEAGRCTATFEEGTRQLHTVLQDIGEPLEIGLVCRFRMLIHR